MSQDSKTQIRIEGHPETDELIRRVLQYSEKIGLKPTTAARMLIKEALDARSFPPAPGTHLGKGKIQP